MKNQKIYLDNGKPYNAKEDHVAARNLLRSTGRTWDNFGPKLKGGLWNNSKVLESFEISPFKFDVMEVSGFNFSLGNMKMTPATVSDICYTRIK